MHKWSGATLKWSFLRRTLKEFSMWYMYCFWRKAGFFGNSAWRQKALELPSLWTDSAMQLEFCWGWDTWITRALWVQSVHQHRLQLIASCSFPHRRCCAPYTNLHLTSVPKGTQAGSSSGFKVLCLFVVVVIPQHKVGFPKGVLRLPFFPLVPLCQPHE